MKTIRYIVWVFFISFPQFYFCQDDEINLDLLRAQSSPAANLLGIANSEIEKPTDVNALMVSLRESSDNFSTLPSSFAIDVAPFKLGGNYQDLRKKTPSFSEGFKQSFVTSFAFKKIEEDLEESIEARSRLGLGVKFSLKRGNLNNKTIAALDKIEFYQKKMQEIAITDHEGKISALFEERKKFVLERNEIKDENSEKYKELSEKIKTIDKQISDETIATSKNERQIYQEKIKEEAGKIKLDRYGFYLDLSMGTVVDFRNNKFDNSQISKTGAWLTGGWNWEKSSSSLIFITRYLYNSDSPLANPELKKENLHTLDMGSRYALNFFNKKFLMSGECIYRSILNKSDYESSWKFLLNFEYEVAKNQRLTFSFGRDFEGEYKKDGNVIVALNLLIGLGKVKL